VQKSGDHGTAHQAMYYNFGIMLLLSFFAMFAFMYAMVDVFANVYPNLNQAYMAGLMVAPMAIFELVIMGSMYPNKRLNKILIAVSVSALALFWVGIREQTAVGNEQFIKSMIPHHAGAILMCASAQITDPELQKLCQTIKSSQQAEIEKMKHILTRLKR
jgi:hypothetical protein